MTSLVAVITMLVLSLALSIYAFNRALDSDGPESRTWSAISTITGTVYVASILYIIVTVLFKGDPI